ncbi:hypothetical protein NC652_036003 [Populus alba x Populus x berolinensis]|nr:hypothetical protein NC652_036003 [Populus alba x Populus x berolinensis]
MRGEGGRRFRENRKGAGGGGGGAAAAAAEGRRVVLCLRNNHILWEKEQVGGAPAFRSCSHACKDIGGAFNMRGPGSGQYGAIFMDAVDDNLTNRSSTAAVMAPREKVEKAGYAPQSLLPVQKSQLELAPRNDSSGESTRRVITTSYGKKSKLEVPRPSAAAPMHAKTLEEPSTRGGLEAVNMGPFSVDAVDDNLTNRSSTAAVMAPREKVEKAGYAPQSLLPVQKSQLELAPRNDSSGESTRRMHGDPGRNVVAAALPQHYSVLPDSIVWSSGAVTTAGVRSGGLMIMILQTFYESPSRKKAVKTPKWLACLLLLKYVAQLNHW